MTPFAAVGEAEGATGDERARDVPTHGEERVTTSGSNCVPEQRSTSRERLHVARCAGAVEAVRGHRVERVGDEDDARAERDLLAARDRRDSPRRPSARGGAAPSRRSARRRGSRASGSRSADDARARAAPRRSAAAGLRRISSGIASLPRSCRLAGEPDQLDLARVLRPSCSAISPASAATRSEWLPV